MTTSPSAEIAVRELEVCKNEIRTIRELLRRELPEVIQALEEAEAELPRLVEAAKTALRDWPPGQYDIFGHSILIKNPPTKVTCDVDGLVDRAEERGELRELIRAKVVNYVVEPHQIARLDSRQRAIYESYLTATTGSPSIVLPPELKP